MPICDPNLNIQILLLTFEHSNHRSYQIDSYECESTLDCATFYYLLFKLDGENSVLCSVMLLCSKKEGSKAALLFTNKDLLAKLLSLIIVARVSQLGAVWQW